ncbi:MAG TPA: hydantoinase/oxoprolinase family protein [Longimicrobiales bacterium]|nr:hydantoinase/oxoprolinase family protein [Longimicrobiales bacterium]
MSDLSEGASTIAVDTGGTFTDVVLAINGIAHVLKVPSSRVHPAAAAIAGMRQLLALHQQQAAGLLVHGSTVATNALLERKGAGIALLTNRGFEDVLEIGRQNRPQLYALSGKRPPPLVPRALRIGIAGRLDERGRELEPLSLEDVRTACRQIDAEAIAICLLHSYANPEHEARVEEMLLAQGVRFVSRSSQVLREYREYERTATTVVNAYVMPLMAEYLSQLEKQSDTRVRVMGSGGGALTIAHARREPVHTVLSGPAGGVAGALAVARTAGIEQIITFDMGGTSTDVSVCPGRPLYTREFAVAGLPVAIPMLEIHTVGAGGGSIAWLDAGGALRVGPHSAGAEPGPICYGRGGTDVTVTDANVWLGRLPPNAFLGGTYALDRDVIREPLARLAERLNVSMDTAAEGILTVVNSTMEGALRVISVERGYDPAQFTLVAFGGAAGLHAAALASSLGVPRILLPPHPGLLSALGMLVAPVRKTAAQTVLLRADHDTGGLDQRFAGLERQVLEEMSEERIAADGITLERFIDARYAGQSHELRVPAEGWVDNLHTAHEARYGFANRASSAEAVTLRVEAHTAASPLPVFAASSPEPANASASVCFDGNWQEALLLARAALNNEQIGPAVIMEYSATTWVPAGWRIAPLSGGTLIMEKMQ